MKELPTVLIFFLLFLPLAYGSIVEVIPYELNASTEVTLNFSINNTENVNISKVTIYIPLGFENVRNIGSSVSTDLVENPTQPNPLIWQNKTYYGFISYGSKEYFWFNITTPSVENANFIFYVNLTYINGTEENISIEVLVKDVTLPWFSEIHFSEPNNTKYSPNKNYGFQIRWKDNVNISTVIFYSNFNNSENITVPLFAGNKNDGIYVINFTDLPAGIYWFIWVANDTSGNSFNTSNITYVILQADNPIKLYINNIPTASTTLENGTSLNITILAIGDISLYKNGSLIKLDRDRLEWNETLDPGFYEFKANVSSSNVNYTSNSTGLTFYVRIIYPRLRFKDLQTPSSTVYSPGATYTFKITFYSPSYPLNNISNVSFTFNDQVYYLPVNKQDNETYTFTIRDLGARNYNWMLCAEDTQREKNCTSGTLTITQAIPRLDIINVQDYVAPVSKTIIGIGCPPQLTCKLYLNNTELPQNFYELNTDRPGYYIFTFNTSGNANYSAASITKAMTVYPPRQTTTTTVQTEDQTQPTQTTTTTTLFQQPQPKAEKILNLQANVPSLVRFENVDLVKVTEVEVVARENVDNVEIKAEIASRDEIPKAFDGAGKNLFVYIKITSNVTKEKLVNVKIRFKVEKIWIDVNNIDENKVSLYKFENDNWIKLPTYKISKDVNNVYYEASLESLSLFAIVGEGKSAFPWFFLLLPVIIVIVAIIVYLFWPTSSDREYEKLKQKWASGGIGE